MSQKYLIMDKKGELTTQQIIMITIIIVSFLVLLFFLFRLNPVETSSKQICYNSVVLADKGEGLIGNLDCRTNYLTITDTDRNEVLKVLADEMADCWWMFGEGKLDYGEIQSPTIKYALCSTVEFDEKTQKTTSEISYSELYEYMRTHQSSHDNSKSYLSYIYGINNVTLLKVQSQFTIDLARDKIKTNQKYSIITGWDDNISPYSDEPLKVYIIPTSETSSKIEEGEFITKAG